MPTLVIDNVGFDVQAMSAMAEKEFIDLHLQNDAICKHGTQSQRTKYLKDAYGSIRKAAGVSKPKKDDSVSKLD